MTNTACSPLIRSLGVFNHRMITEPPPNDHLGLSRAPFSTTTHSLPTKGEMGWKGLKGLKGFLSCGGSVVIYIGEPPKPPKHHLSLEARGVESGGWGQKTWVRKMANHRTFTTAFNHHKQEK